MTEAQRKHVLLPPETVAVLETYQATHGLRSFSSAVEAAAEALARQERRGAYQQYARDYAADPAEQQAAEEWLSLPMDEDKTAL